MATFRKLYWRLLCVDDVVIVLDVKPDFFVKRKIFVLVKRITLVYFRRPRKIYEICIL